VTAPTAIAADVTAADSAVATGTGTEVTGAGTAAAIAVGAFATTPLLLRPRAKAHWMPPRT
jgi:hypothetical protein